VTPERQAVLDLAARLEPARTAVYKRAGEVDLRLHLFEPPGFQAGERRPCLLAIHGGGWAGGEARRFYPVADYFARRGLVAASLSYRLIKPGLATPFDCVRDGRSAMRFLKTHAAELGVDPDAIVACGGSAGAHVAAGTAMFEGEDDPADDSAVSPRPCALVLYYPVIDTSPEGYGNAKCGPRWREISPLHRVRPGLPPTILFHGTADTCTPFEGARRFDAAMREAGNRCDLVAHEGGRHGYFLYDLGLFELVLARTAAFLSSLGLPLV
jgi:acetyl esterase/lipase